MSLAGTPGIAHFAARLPEHWLPVLWWGICESEKCGRVPVGTVPSGRMSAQALHHHSHGEAELLSHSGEAIWPHLKTQNEKEGKSDFHRTQSLKTHITLHTLLGGGKKEQPISTSLNTSLKHASGILPWDPQQWNSTRKMIWSFWNYHVTSGFQKS